MSLNFQILNFTLMKRLAFTLLLNACIQISISQAQSDLKLVHDLTIEPNRIQEMEQSLKEWVQTYKKYNQVETMTTYVTENLHYIINWNLKNLSDLNKLSASVQQLKDLMGPEKYEALHQQECENIRTINTYLISIRDELSYTPKNPRLKSKEIQYWVWTDYHIKPDRFKKAVESLRKIINTYDEIDFTERMNSWVTLIGEGNIISCAYGGKNAGDVWYQLDQLKIKLSNSQSKTFSEFLSTVNKIENHGGYYRPDLSYIPATELATKP